MLTQVPDGASETQSMPQEKHDAALEEERMRLEEEEREKHKKAEAQKRAKEAAAAVEAEAERKKLNEVRAKRSSTLPVCVLFQVLPRDDRTLIQEPQRRKENT